MSTDLSNGTGGIVSVTDTAQRFLFPSQSPNQEYARTVVVWNTGSSTVYAAVNHKDTADFTESTAVPIPAGENYPFVTGRKPIKSLILKCTTGETSTASYGAF